MFKKLLGVLVALFVINTMVQTDAILSLQNQVANTKVQSLETKAVSSKNMQAALGRVPLTRTPDPRTPSPSSIYVHETFHNDGSCNYDVYESEQDYHDDVNATHNYVGQTMYNNNGSRYCYVASMYSVEIDNYLKSKNSEDYTKKVSGIIESLKKVDPILKSLELNDSNDTTELRRFFCWVTGGVWMQIGPSKMCQYHRDLEVEVDYNGHQTENNNTEFEKPSLMGKIVGGEKDFSDKYFSNKNISLEKTRLEIQKILTSEGVDGDVQSLNIRKFFCRLFGGMWKDEEEITVYTGNGSFSSYMSACIY